MAKDATGQPVRLVEDSSTGDRFLIFNTDRGVKVDLRYEGEALWLTQKGMAELFGVAVPTINEHLKHIFAEGELPAEPTIRNFRMVRQEGSRQVALDVQHYNLSAVISVGYRVSSKQGTMFRVWVTEKLVQFATKGFVIDRERQARSVRSRNRATQFSVRHLHASTPDFGRVEAWRSSIRFVEYAKADSAPGARHAGSPRPLGLTSPRVSKMMETKRKPDGASIRLVSTEWNWPGSRKKPTRNG